MPLQYVKQVQNGMSTGGSWVDIRNSEKARHNFDALVQG